MKHIAACVLLLAAPFASGAAAQDRIFDGLSVDVDWTPSAQVAD
ncbi:hypothetical protein N9499_02910 [Octadecabacter sp.]|nr:hypothetical protein [Octadecabacter sp.]